ncbi:hypothetical protein ONZ45_g1472 [Pleurotus djamor]|nr:hypothetical protein ONZ45_g1472 [Pleurotus djamor]
MQLPNIHADDLLIAVMGATGSGKTTFVNLASGSSLAVGNSLHSCTTDVQLSKSFALDGRKVVLADTPGFDDTGRSDTEILKMITTFLTNTYRQGKKLSGIIYMHRISDFRMGGLSTRNLRMVRKLCGDGTLKNLLLVTNMWGEVNTELGERREAELARDAEFFQPALAQGATMVRNTNTVGSSQDILRRILQNQPLPLLIQKEIVDEGKAVSQTAAGVELDRELAEQMQKHEEELRLAEAARVEALRKKEEEVRLQMEARARAAEAEANRQREAEARAAAARQAELARIAQQMVDQAAAHKREQDRLREEHERHLQHQRLVQQQQEAAAAAEAARQHIQLPNFQSEEHLVAVMGATGSGKTSFVNLVSGSSLGVSNSLHSCTSDVQLSESFSMDGHKVVLVDTPGFDDTGKSDTEILNMITNFLANTYRQGKKLTGIIYIHRISDFRMGGLSARNLRMVRKLCGDGTLKNLLLMTNMWGEVDTVTGERREAELARDADFFKPALDRGARMIRHGNTTESAATVLRQILRNEPLPLLIQREVVDEGKAVSQTVAGYELDKDIIEQQRKHEEEIQRAEAARVEALRKKEEEIRLQMEAKARQIEAEAQRRREEEARAASARAAELARISRQMAEQAAAHKREQERLKAQHERELQRRREQLQRQREWEAEQARERAILEQRRRELEAERARQQYDSDDSDGGCTIA